MISTARRHRDLAKAIRDLAFRHVPGLQRAVRGGARRSHLPPALWRRLHPVGTWVLHAPDGTPFTYTSYRHDGLARHVVWTDLRDWEPTTHPVLFDLARHARVFADVGAYSGLYTLLACVANPSLRAVAFEPNPIKLAQLRANMASNSLQDRVTIIGTALSTRGGWATLTIPPDDSTASLGGPGPGDRTVRVPVAKGDDALAGLPVDLVKLDVEGFETEVLTGMAGILTARRPRIIAECLDQRALARLRRTVSALGYAHAYHLDRAGLVAAGDRFTHPGRFPNYLFTAEPMVAR